MGAAVRDARVDVGVIEDFRHRPRVRSVGRIGGEFRPQLLVQGKIEHGVHRVFAGHCGQLRDGKPFILIIPWLPDLDDPHLRPVRHGVGLPAGTSPGADIPPHAIAHFRLPQFGHALFGGADKWIDPARHRIEAVVLGQLEDRRGRV